MTVRLWSLGLAAALAVGAGSCSRPAEIHWRYDTCALSMSPTGGSLSQGMMVRADTVMFAKAAERMGLVALPERVASGDLALRIWHSTRIDAIESGLELRRSAGTWRALRYDMPNGPADEVGCNEVLIGNGIRGSDGRLCERTQALPAHWSLSWDALVLLGILEFEGDARLDGVRTREPRAAGAGWWFVELTHGDRQHAYAFTDPEGEACRQPEAFVRALRLLGRETGFGLVAG